MSRKRERLTQAGEWVETEEHARVTRVLAALDALRPQISNKDFKAELYRLRDSYPAVPGDAVSRYVKQYERERSRKGAMAAAQKKRAKYPEDQVRAAVAKVMNARPDVSARTRNIMIKRELKGHYPERDFSRWIRRYVDEYLANRMKR